jgi:hypothetical protein
MIWRCPSQPAETRNNKRSQASIAVKMLYKNSVCKPSNLTRKRSSNSSIVRCSTIQTVSLAFTRCPTKATAKMKSTALVDLMATKKNWLVTVWACKTLKPKLWSRLPTLTTLICKKISSSQCTTISRGTTQLIPVFWVGSSTNRWQLINLMPPLTNPMGRQRCQAGFTITGRLKFWTVWTVILIFLRGPTWGEAHIMLSVVTKQVSYRLRVTWYKNQWSPSTAKEALVLDQWTACGDMFI